LNIFNLAGPALATALSQLSGEAATGSQQSAFQLMDEFLTFVIDPFVDGPSDVGGAGGRRMGFAAEAPALPPDVALAYDSVLKAPPHTFEQRWSVRGAAYGGYGRVNGDLSGLGTHDLSTRAGGFAGALDYHLTRDSVIGVALAGGETNWGLADGLGGGRSNALQAGVYGATRNGPAYLAGSLAYTWHAASTDRFAFAGDELTARFNAQSFGGRVESGYRLAWPMVAVTPYAAVQAQSFETPSYRETDVSGGGFGLAYAARTATDTRSELGGRFDHAVAINPTSVLALRARLAWAHDWVSDPVLAATFALLPGASFAVNGAVPAKDSMLATTSAELGFVNGVSLLGKFDGAFADRAKAYAGSVVLRYVW
jgi:outer membrane autotransporter protein